MSSTENIVEKDQDQNEKLSSWKDRFHFPIGARLLIFFQLINGMGGYCFISTMPIYMASMLKFSDTTSTTIFHAKSALGMVLNIFGAILTDSFLGRSKTFLYIDPFGIMLIGVICVLSIYSLSVGIIVSYFLIAVVGGLVTPAIRTIISDQISQDNKIMLSTFMHVIYFINSFGIIIIASLAPIMHKDIYCFGIECYPLVFFVSFLFLSASFLTFVVGFCMKLFVIFKPTENLLLDIFRCIQLALKKRISLGKPPKGSTWLDYSSEKFDASLIRDIKIAKGLLIFLLAHPIFWTVFEQMSSIWTLQAQYMDGMVSQSFEIKADQMRTLNPILVVILIPIFELLIYPCLAKINFKVPYRIMMGQIFTALACVSMIFIQIKIDKVIEPNVLGNGEINIINLLNSDLSVSDGTHSFIVPQSGTRNVIINSNKYFIVSSGQLNLNISTNNFVNKVSVATIYGDQMSLNFSSADISRQQKGGYANVRIFNYIDSDEEFSIFLKAQIGINKDFTLISKRNQFGEYSKCGIGTFDVYFRNGLQSINRKIGQIILHPAETRTLVILGNLTQSRFIATSESRLELPTIIWQIIPYLLVTIGEVLFNVNTGIFLYGEAPLTMKSMLLSAQYLCMGLGNILILFLRQILIQLTTVYLFIICSVLVGISAVFTGVLAYFYLKNKPRQEILIETSRL